MFLGGGCGLKLKLEELRGTARDWLVRLVVMRLIAGGRVLQLQKISKNDNPYPSKNVSKFISEALLHKVVEGLQLRTVHDRFCHLFAIESTRGEFDN
jgi:hypothetical protein